MSSQYTVDSTQGGKEQSQKPKAKSQDAKPQAGWTGNWNKVIATIVAAVVVAVVARILA
jgi:hypothetical protein